jgi:hypothetical protein
VRPADGVEDVAEGGLGLLRGKLGSEGLDGLSEGLEIINVGSLTDGVEDVVEAGLGLLGGELGRVWTAWARTPTS